MKIMNTEIAIKRILFEFTKLFAAFITVFIAFKIAEIFESFCIKLIVILLICCVYLVIVQYIKNSYSKI